MKHSYTKAVAALGLCLACLLSYGCQSGSTGTKESTVGTETVGDTKETEVTTMDITETTGPQANAPRTFEELVSELSPLAAWDGEVTDGAIVDKVGGIKGTLIRAEAVKGYAGGGIEFRSAKGAYADFGAMTLADVFQAQPAATVSMWIMPYVNMGNIFRLMTVQVEGSQVGLHIYYNDSYISVYARSGVNDPLFYKVFRYDIYDGTLQAYNPKTNEGQWQHLTASVDFKNKSIRLYINGKEVLASPTEGTDKIAFGNKSFRHGESTDPDCIGGTATSGVQCFNGIVDEIMLFGRVLEKEEIKLLAKSVGTPVSPVSDQKEVAKIVTALGDAQVYCLGEPNRIVNGKTERIDPSDYSATLLSHDGKAYLPQGAAEACFGDAVKSLTAVTVGEKNAYALDALAAAAGKSLLIHEGMYLVVSQEPPLSDEQYARLARFFTDDRPETAYDFELSRTVIAEMGKDGITNFCQSPAILKIGAVIYAAMDCGGYTYVYASKDGGQSFEKRGSVKGMVAASLFEKAGDLYMIGTFSFNAQKNVGIARSTDGGLTWSAIHAEQGMLPNDGLFAHCAPSPVLIHNGKVYKAFESLGNSWKEARQYYIVSASLDSDLLDADSWTVAKPYVYEHNYFTDHEKGSPYATYAYPEEGNAVLAPDGSVYGVYRLNSMPSLGYVVIFKLSEDGKTMTYDPKASDALVELDGGITKFAIRYDASTGLYLAFVNNVTDGRFTYQRNVLSLAVSRDLVNWEPVTTILADRTVMNDYCSMSQHAFQYVDWVFDGEDLLLCVREAMDDSDCWHNANYLTFYRVDGYRALLSEYLG